MEIIEVLKWGFLGLVLPSCCVFGYLIAKALYQSRQVTKTYKRVDRK